MPLTRLERPLTYPPEFLEKVFCPVGILGDFRRNNLILGLEPFS